VAVFAFAMAICAALGVAIERFAYRPLRHRGRLTALITAIGVSFLLEYGFQLPPLLFPSSPSAFPPGPTPRYFPEPFARVDFAPFGVHLSNYDLVSLAVAVGLMFALQFIVYRTKFGVAMRAVSFDANIAALMGIDVNRVISGTFALGSALAAAAALLVAGSRPTINPLMGLLPGIKAFVAAVLGGIGNVPGAMLGGLLLGLTEEYVAGYLLSSYRDGIAFGLLILVLLFRPTGLLGAARAEKV
jgi:branched-chain amino acid transport system permease protein